VRRTILADTGPLYAALDPDDQYHQRAQAELARFEAAGVAVAILLPTLFEAYSLAMQRLGVRVALRWLDEVMQGASVLSPTAADVTAALTQARAYPDQRLTLFDTLISTVSARLDLPVWTYDYHFDVLRATVWR
jgi:predicted nucleic acid-binding protein